MILCSLKVKGRFFLVFLIFFASKASNLSAQFVGYTDAPSSAYASGLFSQGVGIRDLNANLNGNPAFLSYHKQHIVEAGVHGAQSKQTTSNALLYGGGYYAISESFGIGARIKPVISRFNPAEERIFNYTGQLVLSYMVTEWMYLGFGIGPSVTNRIGGYSNYSLNVFGSMGFIYKSFTLGILAESPGANSFEVYLGSEKLKEKYPEKLSIGLQYDINSTFFFYTELQRTFWERITFSLNGLDENPNFLPKNSISGSFGGGIHILKNTNLLMGVTRFANALANGSLDPVYGASIGFKTEIFPSLFGEGLFGSFYVQRTKIRKTIEPYDAETRFGFQFTSQFNVMTKAEENMPKN